jgi:hypothetical protein
MGRHFALLHLERSLDVHSNKPPMNLTPERTP